MATGAAIAAPAYAQDSPSLKWRLASGFPSALDLRFGAGETFCKFVSESTGGKFSIRHLPEGEVAPARRAGRRGRRRQGRMRPRLFRAAARAQSRLCFDAGMPFGLTARQMDAWMMEGEGLRLTRELFKPLKAVNFPLGNTGGQMGGWFRKEVKRVGDLKGLKMRVDGLAADVLARLGVAPQQAALAELAQAARKDGLEAVAGSGAYDDSKLGLNKFAKFYYGPGWWAGSGQLSLYINDEAWSKLPKNYQSVVEAAARAAHAAASARYDARNPGALAQLTANGAQLRAFSRSIMDAAFEATQQLYKELGDKDPAFKALHSSYMGFRDSEMPWFRLTEGAYGQYLGVALSARS
ncbi:ABC transporter substrate-binding protein [Achromobacter xylosoxidans]